MKRLISILLLAAFCISLAACQPTPDEPFVVNKGDGKLMEIIGGAPAPTLSEPYKADEHWTETIDGKVENKLIVEVDATVTVPDVLEYPVYEAVLSDYDQEYVDDFLHNTVGDVDLYTVNGYIVDDISMEDGKYEYGYLNTRDAKLCVDTIDYQLNDPNSPFNKYYVMDLEKNWTENSKKYKEDTIVYLLKEQEACDYMLNHQSELMTKIDKLYDDVPFMDLRGGGSVWYIADGNQKISIQRKRNERYSLSYEPQCVSCYSAIDEERITARKTDLRYLDKDLETALKEAEEWVYKLGLDGWELVNTGSALVTSMYDIMDMRMIYCGLRYAAEVGEADQYDFYPKVKNSGAFGPEAYYFTFAPTQSGIPALYFANKQNNQYSNHDWYMPYLQVAVDDSGVLLVKLVNGSSGFGQCLNKNVPMLSFEEIQQKFRDYIIMNTDFTGGTGAAFEKLSDRDDIDHVMTRIHIDDIRLGYIKIKMINSDEYMTIPAWCFYGTEHNQFKENSDWVLDENNEKALTETLAGHSFLCINAIDGSIIDLTKGY